MTANEKQYKSVTVRVALTLLLFIALFFIYSIAMALLGEYTKTAGAPGDILYNALYGVGYALAFMLPAGFFYLISKGKTKERVYFNAALPKETPLYIFTGLAVILAAAYLNSILLEPFQYSSFSDQLIPSVPATANYEIVLMVFTTAVVPAFVEELLFRGVILTNLLPYGRVTAVFGSALLFGAMHQNAGQFFYAVVAGLVLGYAYVKTRSIWCGVLLHFVNNFYSVLNPVLGERLPEETAGTVLTVTHVCIFAFGVLSFVCLLAKAKDQTAAIRENGAFGVELPANPDYAAVAIPARRRVRLFFNAPMVVFLSVCAVEMLIYVFLAAIGASV